MSDATTCPQCGAEFLPAASPLGICPACLLKLAQSDPSWRPPDPPQTPAEGIPAVVTLPPAGRRVSARSVLAWIGAAALVATISTMVIRLVPRAGAPGPFGNVVRFRLAPPDGATLPDDVQFAIAPDGARIVAVARGSDGRSGLWMRPLQSMDWSVLPGTAGAAQPFWSPDSRRIGFFADRKLKTADTGSGLVLTLCEAPSGHGASWSSQNVILFAPRAGGPLHLVPASGGTPQPATATDGSRPGEAHAWPHFLPDGRRFLFVVSGSGAAPGLYLGDLDRGERTMIVAGAGPAAYAEGLLIVSRGAALMAVPFDPGRARPIGEPVPIAGAEHAGGPRPRFSVSANGVLVHASGGARSGQLTWFDRSGRAVSMGSEPGNDEDFSLAPDGRSVAVTKSDESDGSSSIWIHDFTREMTSRLTFGRGRDRFPLWSPDSQRLVFASGDALNVIEIGGGKPTLVHQSPEPKQPLSWSPDGRQLLYAIETADNGSDLWLLSLEGGKSQPLLRGQFNESDGRISPDGRWIAYVSDESGRDEIYLRAFAQPDGRWQVSSSGGAVPRWRRDGRELFFVSSEGRLMSVDVRGGMPLATGSPHAILSMRGTDSYEVAPDGQRFLLKMPAGDREPDRLQIVLNWAYEIRRAAPR
jgi:eukaryotic-like serine/threonine-protein kinase